MQNKKSGESYSLEKLIVSSNGISRDCYLDLTEKKHENEFLLTLAIYGKLYQPIFSQ